MSDGSSGGPTTDGAMADFSGDDPAVTRAERGDPTADREKWLSGLVGLIGAWVLFQAVLLDPGPARFWNDLVVGLLLAAAGGYNYARRSDGRPGHVAVTALSALLGLWLVASALLFADAPFAVVIAELGFWNAVVFGTAAFVVGATSAYWAYDRKRGRYRAPAD